MNSDPGHIHNLTSTQRLKLAELWAVLLFCLLADSDASLLDLLTDAGEREAVVGIRGQLLKESNEAEAPQDTERRQRQHPKDALSLDLSAFRPQHAALLPEFWRSMGTEHPDVSLLRFLRARKWALIPALEMVLKATKWRIKAGINSFLRDPERDIGFSLSSGKAYIQSYDRLNRPISVSHVAKHEPKAQPLEETMKMCVYLIELGRLMLKGEGETACILFDFRGFGLRNMDYGGNPRPARGCG